MVTGMLLQRTVHSLIVLQFDAVWILAVGLVIKVNTQPQLPGHGAISGNTVPIATFLVEF